MGGRAIWYLIPSFFLCSELFADTIALKNGKNLKGLVVEEHEDRILLSTENGEIPILRRGIQSIEFDDPAQNFLSVGRAYEDKQRWGEALAYYEKALELNPNLADATKAAVRVRNRFWSKAAAGPMAEVEKRQALYETWEKQRFQQKSSGLDKDPQQLMGESLGARLVKKDDWVHLSEVSPKKDAAQAALRANDRLVSVDGDSLRYLSVEAVREKLVWPRYSSFTLEFDRDCRLIKTGFEKEFREFGFELKLEAQGLVVTNVVGGSTAARAGLKTNDLLVGVNGNSTRYLPIKKLMGVIQKNRSDVQAVLTVRRSVILSRH